MAEACGAKVDETWVRLLLSSAERAALVADADVTWSLRVVDALAGSGPSVCDCMGEKDVGIVGNVRGGRCWLSLR